MNPNNDNTLATLDTLARDWHRDAQASERLTRNVREAIRPGRSYSPPRFLVPALASLCVVSVLGASIGLSTLRPPSALAAVQMAMRQVRTAHWRHETQTRRLPEGVVLKTERGSTTVDLLCLAARVETGTSEVYIRTRSGVYWKRNGTLVPDNRVVTPDEVASDLRRRLLPEARMQGREREWQVSEEVWEGRRVRHFALLASPDAPSSEGGMAQDEFWADVLTNRIVATRYRVARREGKHLVEDVFTTSDYEYDLRVPASTFEP